MLLRGVRGASRAFAVPALVFGLAGWLGGGVQAGEEEDDLFIVKSALSPKEFRSFEVMDVAPVTHDSKRVRFALPDKHHELGLSVASCLVAKATVNGETVVRPYTPISRTGQKGHFDLLIKGYPDGKLSKSMVSLQPGDKVEMKGPFSKIPIKRNMKKAIGMVAGGTGLTPMLQVIQSLLDDPRDKTEIRLLYANKTVDDILLKDRLDALALIHPRFKVYYALDQAPEGWDGYTGYVTKEMLAETMPPPSEDHMVFVCGPPPMVKAISGAKGKKGAQGDLAGVLASMKYEKSQVFKF